MALIACPQCSHQISDKALACPKCGFLLITNIKDFEKKPRFNKLQIRLMIASLALLTGAIIVGVIVRKPQSSYNLESNYNQARNYYERGLAKMQSKDYQGAIADFTEAIRLKPDNVDSYSHRGYAKTELKDFKGAITDYNEALWLKTDSADDYSHRGYAKAQLKDFKEAITDYDDAIRRKPNDALTYELRGYAKLSLGDRQGGFADYRIALKFYKQQGETSSSSRLEDILRDEKPVKSK